jgi:hypothetical protein
MEDHKAGRWKEMGMNTMQIELFPYERRCLEFVETAFRVERKTIVGFALSLNALRRLFEDMLGGPDDEFRAGRVVLMGLINHAHHLLVGGLQALEVGNGFVWSACVRGLIETFGACVLISEKPERVTSHLDRVSPKRLYDAAERSRPGLGRDATRLHQIVHPASGAVYSGFTVLNEGERFVNVNFGLRQPEAHGGREGVTVLANLAGFLEAQLVGLTSNPKVLSAGKPVLIRRVDTAAADVRSETL